ncbi:leukocyte tyrosine kinase receptor [Thomomys bottae]
MSRSARLLLWLGAAGAILSATSASQAPSPPVPPDPPDPKVSAAPRGSEPASPRGGLAAQGPWLFNSCGASGRRGPTQRQCDGAYAGSGVAVTVEAAGPLRGAQRWRAPGPGGGHLRIGARRGTRFPPAPQERSRRRAAAGRGGSRGRSAWPASPALPQTGPGCASLGFPPRAPLPPRDPGRRASAPSSRRISAYGAAGGRGARNHLSRAHGVFLSAVFSLGRGEPLYIVVGQQGEDACPGGSPASQRVCLGESHVAAEGTGSGPGRRGGAGGGGGGGGATFVFRLRAGEPEPLLVAAGGGGRAYSRRQDRAGARAAPEKLENRWAAPGSGGRGGAAGGGGGWTSRAPSPQAGRSLREGAEGGQGCAEAWAALGWAAAGGFGGGGGACTAGGGGGGYRGGDASETDILWADGEDGVSFVHPSSELYLQPLAVTENHGEVEIRRHPNCSHCPLQDCLWQAEFHLAECICPEGMHLAADNVTCMDPPTPASPLVLMAAVVATLTLSLLTACGVLILVSQRKWQGLRGARLPGPELELSKLRTSAIRTSPNPYYCPVGLGPAQSWPLPPGITEVSPADVTLLRALGHGAFGEVYEGLVMGLPGDSSPLQVAIKTLPELCSRQDELDFLMEALIISKFSHKNIVRCVGLSFRAAPRLILLELMSGGDMKSFLRQSRPRLGQPSPLNTRSLLHLAQDIAQGCHYLEENHFIHRDIAARNCLLSCTGPGRVAKIGDFGMARDIYRASYYRKGGRALLPVKWMPPEALLEGVFTSKTDSWSFGILLWEIFSLGYTPYPGRTNQEVLDFVVAGSRMDPPRSCPGPVYRIMTQCWQQQPELRPNFASILERLQYCTQDPDVLNSPLPVEPGPTVEEEGASAAENRASEVLSVSQPQNPSSQSLKSWGGNLGTWLSSGLKPLRCRGLQPQNLWNPTYGSWAPRAPVRDDSGIDRSNSSSLHPFPGL